MKLNRKLGKSALMSVVGLTAMCMANAEEYVLYDASKFPAKGTVVTKTSSMVMKDGVMVIEVQGQKIDGKMENNEASVEVFTYDSDTQVTVEVKKKTSESKVMVMGQEQPAPQLVQPLHEQTIILTKTGDQWAGKLKEGEATEAQKKQIGAMAKTLSSDSNDAAVYGTKSRKIGDSWNVDPAKLDSFGANANDLKGTFKVTFKGIEKFQGQDCAVLVADVDVTGETGEGNQKLNIKAKARMLRSLKHLMDFQNTMEGTMKMNGSVPGSPATMSMTAPMVMTLETVVK